MEAAVVCPGELLLVAECPSVRTVELTHANRGDERRVEVPQVDAMFGSRLRLQGLPVSDATAVLAVDCAYCSVAPDVLGRRSRMPGNLDRTELKVDPRPTDSSTERAVAAGGHCRR